jgi:hypothetical protein
MNQSFDTEFGFSVVEPLGFDGQGFQRQTASSMALKMEFNANGNPIYLAIAPPGSTTSDARWQVRKLSFDASGNITTIQYANGSPNFDNVWDDRVSLTYI